MIRSMTNNNVIVPQSVAAAIDEIKSDLINAGESPRPFRILEEIVCMSDDSVREWVREHDGKFEQRRVERLMYAVAYGYKRGY